MKKGHTIKGKVLTPHPAALAAESDLVKLTREFEELKQQLFENDNAISEHREAQNASRIDFDMGMKWREEKIAMLQRQRRVLDAQFTNVSELLRPLVQTHRACNGCAEQPSPLVGLNKLF